MFVPIGETTETWQHKQPTGNPLSRSAQRLVVANMMLASLNTKGLHCAAR